MGELRARVRALQRKMALELAIVRLRRLVRECRQFHISVIRIFPSFHISVIPAEAGIQNPHQQCGIRSQIYPDPDYRRNDGRFDDTA